MGDTDRLRARRHRAHRRGDHALCRRCEAVAPPVGAAGHGVAAPAGSPIKAPGPPVGPPRRRLRDAGQLLAPAVERTLGELKLGTVDDAVATLAQRYAAAIDAAADPTGALEKLGPKLLAVLTALQATPAARARRRGGPSTAVAGGPSRPSRLQQLRDARVGADRSRGLS